MYVGANAGMTYSDKCALACARNFDRDSGLRFARNGYC